MFSPSWLEMLTVTWTVVLLCLQGRNKLNTQFLSLSLSLPPSDPVSLKFVTVQSGPMKWHSGVFWSVPRCSRITCPMLCSRPSIICAGTAPLLSARHHQTTTCTTLSEEAQIELAPHVPDSTISETIFCLRVKLDPRKLQPHPWTYSKSQFTPFFILDPMTDNWAFPDLQTFVFDSNSHRALDIMKLPVWVFKSSMICKEQTKLVVLLHFL